MVQEKENFCVLEYAFDLHYVRKDMDVNEHERVYHFKHKTQFEEKGHVQTVVSIDYQQ